MAKIISIVPKRHLVTYVVSKSKKLRGCAYYDYKVFVELDNGKYRLLSADDYDIDGHTAQEIIDDNEKEGTRIFDDVVNMDLFNEFVLALQYEGDKPMDAIDSVLFTLKGSGCQCSGDVEKLIENVYPNIP